MVSGKVARIEKFGAFVTLSDGVDGLIHISELSWSRVEDPQQVVQMGQTVQVKILSTEYREGRLKVALSLKAAAGDPWSLAAQRYPVGSVVKGQIQRREPFGLFVQLEEGIVGLFPKSKAVDDPKFAYDKFRAKDEVTLQVAELNIEQRRMTLKLPGDSGEENWKGFASASSGSFGTLGDQLRARTSSKAEPKKERKK